MKLIKSFILVAAGLCVGTLLQAQQVKPEIAKPVAELKSAPANDTKPDPKLIVNGATADNRNEKQKPETELKVMDTKTVPATDAKAEEVKPQLAPATNIIIAASTIVPGNRNDAVRPVPMIPAENKTTTTSSPVKTEIKKPEAVQQKPNQN